jgi:hypothetical protein
MQDRSDLAVPVTVIKGGDGPAGRGRANAVVATSREKGV